MNNQKRNYKWKIVFVLLLLTNLLLMVGCEEKMFGLSLNKKRTTKKGTIERNISGYEDFNKINVEVDIGDIKVSYGTDDFIIKANYHLQYKSKTDISEIIEQIEIHSVVEEETLFIDIVKKDDASNIWMWIKDHYKDIDFYVDLDIVVPKTTEYFHLYSHLGDITLANLNGEVYAKSSLGDITLDEVHYSGDCVIKSDMGNIKCKLASNINQSSHVNLYTSMGDIIIDTRRQKYKTIVSEEEMMSAKSTIQVGLSTITSETNMGDIKIK